MQGITDYTDEEYKTVLASAIKKKENKIYQDQVLKKHYRLRNLSIQSYFLRLSAEHKKQCVLKFANNITSVSSLFQIFSIMSLGHSKMDVYSVVDPETNCIHDKLLLDNDRMLDNKTLQETMVQDVDWVTTLDDNQQINLTLGLIRIGGGTVKRTLYIPLYRIYLQKLCVFRRRHFTCISTSDECKSILKLEELEEEYDPKHPATIDVDKHRKKWLDLMTKYKNEILPDRSQKKPKKGKKKNKSKIKKSKKIQNNKEKLVTFKEIDLIQLLPIWIVKKIFCYFNTKELTKLKKVNNYWEYVIKELLKERKARDKINEALDQMKATITPEAFQKATQAPKQGPLKGVKQKVFHELGAIARDLIPKHLTNLLEDSLQRTANKDRKDEFDMTNGEWVPFPRLIQKELELYRFRPGFLQDVGVRFDVDDEIQRQKSFLTYSLSRSLSSLKITVEEEIRSEW